MEQGDGAGSEEPFEGAGDLGQLYISASGQAQNLKLVVEALPSAGGAAQRSEGGGGAAGPLSSAHPWPPGYVDVGLIPAGAREIRIEEVAEAANFLALRSEDPEKYFLNGGWTIQWNGEYEVAGTTFTYARTGNWENLTSPGPTNEPVWIQVPVS